MPTRRTISPPGLDDADPKKLNKVGPEEKDFAAYLNWLSHADATLTFPQTVFSL